MLKVSQGNKKYQEMIWKYQEILKYHKVIQIIKRW